ncbi:zinc-binding dehydrogenase [Leifsonia poae]|uniref:Oxidoreductase n=1 Tax=Leifsonia poae TaxID=110933 RepID=A0A9W6HA28_9MICO|nr:zinc-binding dehydrogenase [Leifsonia poae]GLJ76137.1 oxidoreductase [Leifsonia poae]
MRAIAIQEFGDPGGMAVVDLPAPEPGAGQVLIETEAIGVGGVDAVIRRGTLGSGYPRGMIPGSEVAGTIIGVGAGVAPSWIGQHVWAFTGTAGGYGELVVAEAVDVTPLSAGLSPVDAVTIGSAATVARFALARAPFASGESVLIRGAAGSIGIAAVELAARGGASVVAVTTSSAERGRRLAALGATDVLDRSGNGSGGIVRRFDVIVDIVGGDAVPTFIDRLAPNGRMVLVGAVAGFPPADFGMRLLQSFQESRSVATFSLASIAPSTRSSARTQLFEATARRELHPVVHAIMPLERAAEAHRLMDEGTVFGRIVLTP